jgi:hypothetical protein
MDYKETHFHFSKELRGREASEGEARLDLLQFIQNATGGDDEACRDEEHRWQRAQGGEEQSVGRQYR